MSGRLFLVAAIALLFAGGLIAAWATASARRRAARQSRAERIRRSRPAASPEG